MNKYVKAFFHRGLIFGGFGPIVTAIVYFVISLFIEDLSLSATEVLTATVSTYVLAFIHAGASVFNQIDDWPTAKSLLFHLASLYVAYSLCYIANSWIPFEPMVLLIFTLIFMAVYFVVWIIVVLSIKAFTKKINAKLN